MRFSAFLARPADLQVFQVVSEMGTYFRVLQGQFDGGLEETFLAAAVIPFAGVLKSVDAFFAHQSGNTIGQLNLSADAGGLAAYVPEHGRRQDVASRHPHA